MVYQWKPAAHIRADPQTAGQVCEGLEKIGALTPKRLVEISRPEDAPLHDEFEWDDEAAAEKWRENQASHIIRCLIRVPESPDEPVTRAFFPVSTVNTYSHITRILAINELKSVMLEQAFRELLAFKAKFAALTELEDVMAAVDIAVEKRRKPRPDRTETTQL